MGNQPSKIERQMASYDFPEELYNCRNALVTPKVWTSLKDSTELIQFQQSIRNYEEIGLFFQFFTRRYHHPYLVSSQFISCKSKPQCSDAYEFEVHVFYERIISSLSRITDIVFPESLHLMMNAIKGFKALYNLYGSLYVSEQMIFMNERCEVKVWCNSNINKQNSQYFSLNPRGSEEHMLKEFIDIVSVNIMHCPQNQLLYHSLTSKYPSTFNEAIYRLRRLCAQQYWTIPDCITSLKAIHKSNSNINCHDASHYQAQSLNENHDLKQIASFGQHYRPQSSHISSTLIAAQHPGNTLLKYKKYQAHSNLLKKNIQQHKEYKQKRTNNNSNNKIVNHAPFVFSQKKTQSNQVPIIVYNSPSQLNYSQNFHPQKMKNNDFHPKSCISIGKPIWVKQAHKQYIYAQNMHKNNVLRRCSSAPKVGPINTVVVASYQLANASKNQNQGRASAQNVAAKRINTINQRPKSSPNQPIVPLQQYKMLNHHQFLIRRPQSPQKHQFSLIDKSQSPRYQHKQSSPNFQFQIHQYKSYKPENSSINIRQSTNSKTQVNNTNYKGQDKIVKKSEKTTAKGQTLKKVVNNKIAFGSKTKDINKIQYHQPPKQQDIVPAQKSMKNHNPEKYTLETVFEDKETVDANYTTNKIEEYVVKNKASVFEIKEPIGTNIPQLWADNKNVHASNNVLKEQSMTSIGTHNTIDAIYEPKGPSKLYSSQAQNDQKESTLFKAKEWTPYTEMRQIGKMAQSITAQPYDSSEVHHNSQLPNYRNRPILVKLRPEISHDHPIINTNLHQKIIKPQTLANFKENKGNQKFDYLENNKEIKKKNDSNYSDYWQNLFKKEKKKVGEHLKWTESYRTIPSKYDCPIDTDLLNDIAALKVKDRYG